jgi:hypothetical protein
VACLRPTHGVHFHDATDMEDCRVVEASHQNSLPGLVLASVGAGCDMFWSVASGAALSRSRAICTLAQLVALVVSTVIDRPCVSVGWSWNECNI